jgi:hypothetical protein
MPLCAYQASYSDGRLVKKVGRKIQQIVAYLPVKLLRYWHKKLTINRLANLVRLD